jgi:hypothetical protein
MAGTSVASSERSISDSDASAGIAARIPRMTALMSLASAGMPRYAAAGIAGEKA